MKLAIGVGAGVEGGSHSAARHAAKPDFTAQENLALVRSPPLASNG
jgi:hypothetical protein